jgi:hypothetical protein
MTHMVIFPAATQRQAVNPDAHAGQRLNGAGHIDAIAPDPVQYRDNQHVTPRKLPASGKLAVMRTGVPVARRYSGRVPPGSKPGL